MAEYIVKSGDTLWGIAQNLLGSGSRWRELQGYSGDPRRLPIGTRITAPESGAAPAPSVAGPLPSPGAPTTGLPTVSPTLQPMPLPPVTAPQPGQPPAQGLGIAPPPGGQMPQAPGGFAQSGSQATFLTAINQMLSWGNKMEENRNQRNKLLMQLYDRQLTPEELRTLSPNQQDAIRRGDKNLVEFQIMRLNDVIRGREDENKRAMDFLLDGYQMDLKQAEELQREAERKKKEAESRVLDLVGKVDLSTLDPGLLERFRSGSYTTDDLISLDRSMRSFAEAGAAAEAPTGGGGTIGRIGGTGRRSSRGRRNELTMTEAKRLGLPLELVGMTEAEVGAMLADPNPPDWFVTKVQEEKQQSLMPSYVKQLWDEFRRTAQQPSTRTNTSSRTSSSTSSRLTIPQDIIEAAMREP